MADIQVDLEDPGRGVPDDGTFYPPGIVPAPGPEGE